MKVFPIRIDENTREKLQKLADKKKVGVTTYAREVLENHVLKTDKNGKEYIINIDNQFAYETIT